MMRSKVLLDQRYMCDKTGDFLELNQLVRHSHEECGDTKDRLYVKKVQKGYLFHCHNCAPDFSGFMPFKEVLTPEQIKKRLSVKKREVGGGNSHTFPEDYSQDLPSFWRAWLAKAGITAVEAEHFGIGYSPSNKHLIMPVYDEYESIMSWSERVSPAMEYYCGPNKPKYLLRAHSPPIPADHLHVEWAGTDYLVIVEDFLSAIKVGRVANTLCLNGSNLPDYLIPTFRKYNKIIIWLDDDKAIASRRFRIRLQKLGINADCVMTQQDPKYVPDETITNLLKTRINK